MAIIKIRDCKCIKQAELEIIENQLNIKFGRNGTGKSSVGEALSANSMKLRNLRTYGNSNYPNIDHANFDTIKIFDWRYINEFSIENCALPVDGYNVFLRDKNYETKLKKAQKLMEDLQSYINKVEVQNIKNYCNELIDLFNYQKGEDYKLSRNGAQRKIFDGDCANFSEEIELKKFEPIFTGLEGKLRNEWAQWVRKGHAYSKYGICPYCAQKINETENNEIHECLEHAYQKKDIEVFDAIINKTDGGVKNGILDNNAIDRLYSYMNNGSLNDEIYINTQCLVNEALYIYSKINNIKELKPLNVELVSTANWKNEIQDLKIDKNTCNKYFSTKLIRNVIGEINELVEDILEKANEIYGLFKACQDRINKIVQGKKDLINEFLVLAGFPYSFSIQTVCEGNANALLMPNKMSDVLPNEGLNCDIALSWGEKNAFALVMFVFECLAERPDLIILDDPITSFDKDKKYAIIRRLFMSHDYSLKNKTVLMLTHDTQPIIDLVYNSAAASTGLKVNATYLYNDDGIIDEIKIDRDSLVNTLKLYKRLASSDSTHEVVKVVSLRKFVELTEREYMTDNAYNLLSNLIHGRNKPKKKLIEEDGRMSETFIDMSDLEIEDGEKSIRQYIGDFEYIKYLKELKTSNLIQIINDSSDKYEKIIALRVILQKDKNAKFRGEIKKKQRDAYKYVDELNHIENDYIYQLNPEEFDYVPETYYNALVKEIQTLKDVEL